MISSQPVYFYFRDAMSDDAALLADLGWRTFQEAFGPHNKPADMEAFHLTMYSPELQAEELADANTEFVIVEANDVPIAYIKLNADEAPEAITASNPLQISRLYILQQWTGHGLGDRLMHLAFDRATRKGHDVLWLTVWEHNERAKRFYQKYKFREVGELEFILGQDIQRDLYMQRKVTQGI